ncbi:Rpn family recombination-promoting nuclease/putative transposase [Clostridium sp. CF011]|uniref:Rpn family recombination-promoting nuclease/putative transposase n=1 Tax=Clostridium sp. CF011 TaxID=2843318 RepID=UPI002376FF1D|nr:Rpn family recombination-promoting nuclease/putative transposase [Clostridium sp. CF011]
MEIHFIEMEKFRKLRNKNLKEDKLQRWLSFFREDISEKELKELTDMDVDIRKAEEKIEYLSSDPKTLELYKARERSLHERANMISSAKDEGVIEGIEKGKIKVAENFLNMGLLVEQVAKGSELSVEKIIEIKKKMMN